MTLDELHEHLRALRHERRGYLVTRHVFALHEALALPWVDAVLAAKMLAALRERAPSPAWNPSPLRLGEGYLMLCSPGGAEASCVRWRSVEGAMAVRLTAECASALDGAWRGLVTTAALADVSLPRAFARGGFEAPGLATATVDGASLGASACAAWMSRITRTALPTDLAASARVCSDGALAPVEHLPQKLTALRAQWPDVRRVIVASAQEVSEAAAEGFALLRCATLAEALAHWGLRFDGLDRLSDEALEARVAAYKHENTLTHSSERWKTLSAEAWAAGQWLHRDETLSVAARRAFAWSALFALHAGDHDSAREIIRSCSVEDVDDASVTAWFRVVEAAGAIDLGAWDQAFSLATEAAALSQDLPSEHRWIHGHACGTRGRALLHAGRHDEALADLLDTVAWFEARREPWEAARTSKDVATCLRLLGRHDEALAVVTRALEWLATRAARKEVSAKTRIFLRLEQGRCLLALGRPAEAVAPLEEVERAQLHDRDYPRLGAVRGLVVAFRRLGRGEASQHALSRCVEVASSQQVGPAIARVAAVVAAEALADQDLAAWAYARPVWERHWGVASEDATREVLARQVY